MFILYPLFFHVQYLLLQKSANIPLKGQRVRALGCAGHDASIAPLITTGDWSQDPHSNSQILRCLSSFLKYNVVMFACNLYSHSIQEYFNKLVKNSYHEKLYMDFS